MSRKLNRPAILANAIARESAAAQAAAIAAIGPAAVRAALPTPLRADDIATRREAERRAERTQSTGKGYTLAELRAAFDLVADFDNWKNPIDAWIHHHFLMVVQEAVRHFAGCQINVVGQASERLHITAVGYYAAVGA